VAIRMAVKFSAVSDAPSVNSGSEVAMNSRLRTITSASRLSPRISVESAENSVAICSILQEARAARIGASARAQVRALT
jgi:hypothetical protein